MTYSQSATDTASLIWPITHQGKMIAQQFAHGHGQPDIAERVRRNTLAVWVMHEFLDALGIPTDLATSDSWNPTMQLIEDVADLMVPGVGRVECRPVSLQAEACPIPPEVLTERIGYVSVALDEVAGEASLLGFVAEVSQLQPRLELGQLRPMDDFPEHLHQLRQGAMDQVPSQLTRLSRWLGGYFENGWQSVEDLLAQSTWTPAFRQGVQLEPPSASIAIKRAKPLDLGLQLGAEQVALVLEVEPENESVVNIGVRIYPLGGPPYLPEGLTVTILDGENTVCLTAQARNVDNYLQLYFRGHLGEPFCAQLALGNERVVENFII
ncbi:DUF1822 family protein [Leptothoe sp. PORK10 BA2]|uniref:DUF1822 family protein n=1 Tax=Leptothoe sp. PORK10 BA2 TaxID=3110254 RepID=UPI002B1F19A0|nr:DUF1822 family protein [Leptothoe sp. PORK10 BA2]MEA5463417.1 DUF1822 family protein [Leptothoe sp. PORK10 BA2]